VGGDDYVPDSQIISTTLNGVVKQSEPLSSMIFKVPEIIAFVTAVMTLLPGDVILTGTPAGIGPMSAGSTVEVSIEGLGTLTNKVSGKND
jgi:2-keto-4-pentenoate hydratase/2-oxohepta-3-ene-1,7-dioic acid hydratase in catechol pathway